MGSNSTRILIGKITGAHGIKGEVKLLSYAADAGLLFRAQGVFTALEGGKVLKLSARAQTKPDMYIVRIEGVADRNQSEMFRNTPLYIERADLPVLEEDDAFYLSDLEGLEVRSVSGEVLGVVLSVQNFGASDLIDVRGADGKTQYYPLAEPFLVETNVEAGFLVLDMPEILGANGE